jgi:hypothetical protein
VNGGNNTGWIINYTGSNPLLFGSNF